MFKVHTEVLIFSDLCASNIWSSILLLENVQLSLKWEHLMFYESFWCSSHVDPYSMINHLTWYKLYTHTHINTKYIFYTPSTSQTKLIQWNTLQVYLIQIAPLHVCYMFGSVLRPSSGMPIQKSYKERCNEI